MSNGSYPSRSKAPNVFKGAHIDIANKKVLLHGAAVCNPSPSVIPTNIAWDSDYPGWSAGDTAGGRFTVYLSDLSEYHFDLP